MRGSVILFRGSSSTHHASIHLPRQLFRTKTCGPRHSIWSLLTCSFTHHNFHCYWLGLFLWTEMLYMEWTHLFIYSSQLPLLLMWIETLYMEWTHLFIYSSQLPLLLTWFILVDWDALCGVNPVFIYSLQLPLLFTLLILVDWDALYGVVHWFTYRSYHCYWFGLFLWTEMLYMELTHMFIYSSQLPLLFTSLILVDWDALYGVVHLLIAATIAIGLAYSCGLRHSIWSESIHENLILENSVWVGQAMDSWQINRLKYQLVLVFLLRLFWYVS